MKSLLKKYLLTGLIFTITTIGTIPANAAGGDFVTINGNALYYEVHGDSSSPYYPILLLHGGFADIDTWSEQIDELEGNGFQVIALESRGHGRSRGETGDITYALMADDVAAFIEFLKDPEDPIIDTDKVSIVGWSDGGVIALNVCKVRKDLVYKAVVTGTNVQTEDAFTAEGLPGFENLGFEDLLNTTWLFNSSMNLARPTWIDKKQSEWDGSTWSWRTKWNTFRNTMRAVWQTPCYIPQDQGKTCLESLNSIDTPIYVVVGKEEETILESHTDLIHANLPNSELEKFDDAGHNLPRQQSETFNALLVSYLSD